jgi:dihydropteroate synthase
MAKALDAGARIINDVAGLRDEGAEALVAQRSCPVVIMHMQGQPGTMQKSPSYDFVAADVYDWLEQRIAAATAANVPRSQIAVDIGFGFGKTPQHNMTLMAWLSLFHGLGVPLLLGVSRKSTISHFSKAEKAKDRMPGSLALATLGYSQGVQMFRVHDVAETAQALALAAAMRLADQH